MHAWQVIGTVDSVALRVPAAQSAPPSLRNDDQGAPPPTPHFAAPRACPGSYVAWWTARRRWPPPCRPRWLPRPRARVRTQQPQTPLRRHLPLQHCRRRRWHQRQCWARGAARLAGAPTPSATC